MDSPERALPVEPRRTMPADHRLNRALRRLQRVAGESVRLSERASDEDERFMALHYAMLTASQMVEKVGPHTADEDGRLACISSAVRWWRAQRTPRPGEDAGGAVREANDRMKEAVGVIGLASSENRDLWAKARSWAAAHPLRSSVEPHPPSAET